MTLGEYIRRYRSRNKITVAQLAEKLNYHNSHLSYIENDWIERCTLKKFIEIVTFLKLTPQEIYDIIETYYQRFQSEVKDGKRNC